LIDAAFDVDCDFFDRTSGRAHIENDGNFRPDDVRGPLMAGWPATDGLGGTKYRAGHLEFRGDVRVAEPADEFGQRGVARRERQPLVRVGRGLCRSEPENLLQCGIVTRM